jgi:hypothetical protein
MPNPWTAVDDLLHELGSIRRIAPEVQADQYVTAALERAIGDAAQAIDFTIDAPTDAARLLAARDALGVAEELILALDAQFARALRARTRSIELRSRAADLLFKARLQVSLAPRDPRPGSL